LPATEVDRYGDLLMIFFIRYAVVRFPENLRTGNWKLGAS
jgi:hypothetical protein